jgi:two-component system KDP operon response regulator KdpE
VIDMELVCALAQARPGPAASLLDRTRLIGFVPRGDLWTRLTAVDQGVDDVLTSPLLADELIVKVVAAMRRHYGRSVPVRPVIRLGGAAVDVVSDRVEIGARQAHLTSVEKRLLYLLAANAGRMVSRSEILDIVWGVDHVPNSNVVDRHIHNLRAKLGDTWRQPRVIVTVHGYGYHLVGDWVGDDVMTG